MTVTFAPELGEAARAAAGRLGQPLDEWIAAAVELKLREEEAARRVREERERARAEYFAYMEEYQAEFGAFTDEERAAARRELGIEDAQ